MQVRLEKIFAVDAEAAVAWDLLRDIPHVAECMPGAQVAERLDENRYKGQVKFKLGPVSVAFAGTIEQTGIEAAQHKIQMYGKGADVACVSAASMDLTAYIREVEGGKSELVGVADFTVSGKMVSFGNRMIMQASDQVLKQFGAAFASRVAAMALETKAAPEAEAPVHPVAHEPKEVNAFVFIWSVLVAYFKSFFTRPVPAAAENEA